MTTTTLETAAVAAHHARLADPMTAKLVDASVNVGLLNAELTYRRAQLRDAKPGDRTLLGPITATSARNAADRAAKIDAARAELDAAERDFADAKKSIPDETAAATYRAETVRLREQLRRREQTLAAYDRGVALLPVMRSELERLEARNARDAEQEAEAAAAIQSAADAADARMKWLGDRIATLERESATARAALDTMRETVAAELEAAGVHDPEWSGRVSTKATAILNDRLGSEHFPEPVV